MSVRGVIKNLDTSLEWLGEEDIAAEHYLEALRLSPNHASAREATYAFFPAIPRACFDPRLRAGGDALCVLYVAPF